MNLMESRQMHDGLDELKELKERVSVLEQAISGFTALLLQPEEGNGHTDMAKQYFDTFRKGARQ